MGYLDNTALSNVLTKLKTWINSNVANKSHNHTKSEVTDFPSNVSAFNNDSGYLTSHQDISGKVNKTGDTILGALTFGNEDSVLDSTHIEFNVLTDNSEVDAYKAGFYSETDTNLYKTEVKSSGITVDCGSEGKASIKNGTITGDVVKTTAGADLDSVNNALSDKQDKTDNDLQTTSKTIVGAINEVKSSLSGNWELITTLQEGQSVDIPYDTYMKVVCIEASDEDNCVFDVSEVIDMSVMKLKYTVGLDYGTEQCDVRGVGDVIYDVFSVGLYIYSSNQYCKILIYGIK